MKLARLPGGGAALWIPAALVLLAPGKALALVLGAAVGYCARIWAEQIFCKEAKA